MNADKEKKQLETLMAEHEEWRRACINLIAAENVVSPQVRAFLTSDLVQRYGDYVGRDLEARKYFGNKYVVGIEEKVTKIVQEVFAAPYVELRALSGHVAGSAVIMGLTQPGDTILELGREEGGHRLASKLASSPLAQLDVRFLPFNPAIYNIDVPRTISLIKQCKPKLVILGSSNFLFPHPVSEISEALSELPETILAYDASHVFGLIAGKRFQDPLKEGAQIAFGSTHKTLPGPQGGLILSNSEELIQPISEAVSPGLVSNHHLARLPALGISLLELERWGEAYAAQTVSNAQTLGKAIHQRGVNVVGADLGYTLSHTILLQTKPFGLNGELCALLEEAMVIANTTRLPEELGGEGIRLGLQELTRLGAKEEDMPHLAELITDVITRRKQPGEVRSLSQEYAERFQDLRFSWDSLSAERIV